MISDPRAMLKKFLPDGYDMADAVWTLERGRARIPIAKHKALEAVSANLGVVFSPPTIIECDASNKIAVVCVSGTLKDRSEWSIGEAAPYNNKNTYPYAMAEKRAKDRVILKLINLHGDLYSETEADEFQTAGSGIDSDVRGEVTRKSYDELTDLLASCATQGELQEVWGGHKAKKTLYHLKKTAPEFYQDAIDYKDDLKMTLPETS